MSNTKAIRFEAVTKEHRSPTGEVVYALSGFDLDVFAGQTTCLIGRSGSGKSTALKLVNRMEEPTTGRVMVFGEDIATVDPIPLRRKIGYVIQSVGLFPHLTIAANVGILGRATGMARRQIARRVDELLALVRLDPAEFRDRYPSELSGGQRQRAGVARALFADPPLILLDEPFGALDPITRTALHEEFEALTRALKKTILLVTHDIEEAYRLGNVIALIDEGRLVQCGSPEDFRERPSNDFVAQFVRGALQ